MSREFGEAIEDAVLNTYWKLIHSRARERISDVWDRRYFLPVLYTGLFEVQTDSKPAEIPLVGEGYIRFGITGASPYELSIDARFSTARGDTNIINGSIVVVPRDKGNYPFDMFADEADETELIKLLARLKPERDIDWNKLEAGTLEMAIALDLCHKG